MCGTESVGEACSAGGCWFAGGVVNSPEVCGLIVREQIALHIVPVENQPGGEAQAVQS